jgi:hypothetical protein
MKKISSIFSPLFSLFTIDYEKRLLNHVELTLYEAKRRYIEAAQMKQHYDAEVTFQANRINMLTEMVSLHKGHNHVKVSPITTANIYPSKGPSSGQGNLLPS